MKNKSTLLIHNPCNDTTRYFRYYNFFWDTLTYELSKKFNIIENRYFEHAHSSPMPIHLKNATVNNLAINESEYVIENLDSGEFYILSTADILSGSVIEEKENPYLKKVLISQYIDKIIKYNVGAEHIKKYSPWIYFQCDLLNMEEFFYKRKFITNFNKKLYFRGNVGDRPILNHFSPVILDSGVGISSNIYFNELIQYEIALSIAGRGELCYRDVECMAIGIPIIRFEYASTLKKPLIPNFHYIAIERPIDLPIESHTCGVGVDRLGLEHHAKLIEQKYFEVIENKELLDFISFNARQYYEKYFMYPNNVKNTIKLLGI